MPNIKSAAKRVEITEKNNQRNRAIRSTVKTAVKNAGIAAEANAPDTEAVVRTAVSTVDKAVAKGTIHKNAANRKKAQLAKLQAGN